VDGQSGFESEQCRTITGPINPKMSWSCWKSPLDLEMCGQNFTAKQIMVTSLHISHKTPLPRALAPLHGYHPTENALHYVLEICRRSTRRLHSSVLSRTLHLNCRLLCSGIHWKIKLVSDTGFASNRGSLNFGLHKFYNNIPRPRYKHLTGSAYLHHLLLS
jgi:hypothetical protein